MSRSFRTEPKWRVATRNAKRDSDGSPRLPRIVERAPRIGDVHPVSKRKLTELLAKLPLELYHGLKLIELCPRRAEWGRPYGSYSPSSKTIRLYSLPPELIFRTMPRRRRVLFEASGAKVRKAGQSFLVAWTGTARMGFWFYYDVVVHELGHHHLHQYPTKRRVVRRTVDEELLADRYCYWATAGRLSPKKYPFKRGQPKSADSDGS